VCVALFSERIRVGRQWLTAWQSRIDGQLSRLEQTCVERKVREERSRVIADDLQCCR
jgi:hypothetical protein